MIQETEIERHLKRRLEEYGFKVLKFTTPGTVGVMDRIILRPKYSPGAPAFLELKKFGKRLRRIQERMGQDFTARGCRVLDPVHSMAECDERCDMLIAEIMPDYAFTEKL